jgi:hypothetical protein
MAKMAGVRITVTFENTVQNSARSAFPPDLVQLPTQRPTEASDHDHGGKQSYRQARDEQQCLVHATSCIQTFLYIQKYNFKKIYLFFTRNSFRIFPRTPTTLRNTGSEIWLSSP